LEFRDGEGSRRSGDVVHGPTVGPRGRAAPENRQQIFLVLFAYTG
jgi:hypothetical protein